MGRPRRVTAAGIVYHVLNRANRRGGMIHKPGDFDAFARIRAQGGESGGCKIEAITVFH